MVKPEIKLTKDTNKIKINYRDQFNELIDQGYFSFEGPFSKDHYIIFQFITGSNSRFENKDVVHSDKEPLEKIHEAAVTYAKILKKDFLKDNVEIIDETGLAELVKQA